MNIFRVHRNERVPALVALVYIVLLNVLHVLKYYDRFSVLSDDYHNIFWKIYCISGYDPYTYETLSKWDVWYEPVRHPLMAFYLFVPQKINEVLIALTGTNWATIIVGILWTLCAFYAFIFLFRILHELQGLSMKLASLLCALFYSFGYTMLSIFVSDHFGVSVMLLLMTIYLIGLKSKEKKEVSLWQSIILFILTAGVSLSNGIKVFLAAWINKGRRFFKPKYLLCAVILPAVLLFCFAQLEQQVFVQPRLDAAQQQRVAADKKWRAEVYKTYCDTTSNSDTVAIKAGVDKIIQDSIWAKFRADHKRRGSWIKGKALSKKGLLRWTDISTPRWASLKENVIGEPVQMHEDHFLEDVFFTRPIIVPYNHWYNYLAEIVLILLMLMGIWVGRHQKVVWMVLSFFAFDMLIHFVLGFGLNEVYMMSPHYLYMMPIVIAPLLVSKIHWIKNTTIVSTIVLTLWFFYWNLSLLLPFLTTKI